MSSPAPDTGLHDRYPGPRSFADDAVDQRLFFGREEETETLTHRVRSARMLVLFGKSGLGKTSLLQAGLFPRLRAHGLLPVPVRVNHPDESPVATVIEAVLAECRHRGVDTESGDRSGLWAFLKTTDLWLRDTLLTPVLVLDQFEEIFTLQDAAFRRVLARELRDLAGRGLPESARRVRDRGGRLPYSSSPPELRVIMSFREEYLAFLEELVADVPAILEHRYRLTPLDGGRARRAIEAPAAVADGTMFRSQPFAYAEHTLDAMLGFLSNRLGEVEPFQLQVLCRHVEQAVMERQRAGATPVTVDDALLGGPRAMSAVLTRFYQEGIDRIRGRRQRRRARRLCEVGLLSPDGRRVSVEEGSLRREFKLRPATLGSLIDSRLVRKDTRPGLDGFYYELSHDSLTVPVREGLARHQRRRVWPVGLAFVVVAGLGLYGWYSAQLAQHALQAATSFADPLKGYAKEGGRGPDMVKISPGEFRMGELGREADRRERPVHAVTIARPYSMGRYEVTFEEFGRFCEARVQAWADRLESAKPAALASAMREAEAGLRTRIEQEARARLTQEVHPELEKRLQAETAREVQRRLEMELKKYGGKADSAVGPLRKKLEPGIRRDVEAKLKGRLDSQVKKEVEGRLPAIVDAQLKGTLPRLQRGLETALDDLLPELVQESSQAAKQIAALPDPAVRAAVESVQARLSKETGPFQPCPSDQGWGRGRQPVLNVSWADANGYARWLSEQTGKRYRLPSESEWEYAARAGTVTAYWWGDGVGEARANCNGCGSQWGGRQPAPVGSFGANPWGLNDTSGNLWEWVADCWHDGYSGAPSDGSAWDSEKCASRVVRGGSWDVPPINVRSASRAPMSADFRGNEIGFRLVREE